MDVDKKSLGGDHENYENQLYEEMTFDRCFYIYGGPEQLEELEALSSHYTLLFNRRKAKLSSEDRLFYEGMAKQVQQILNLNTETERTIEESDKGKKIEVGADGSDSELKSLHDSSLSKAADLAAGFTSALTGLSANDIIQRTAGRVESLHSEGVHRLSEICCFAVSQLLIVGKSIISNASKDLEENADEAIVKIEWPEDSLEKAKIIRSKAQSMAESMEAVSNSFITGISDVTEAYLAALKVVATTDSQKLPRSQFKRKPMHFQDVCAQIKLLLWIKFMMAFNTCAMLS
ncbi:Sensor protein CutS [Bienertia sinuspersici]